MDIIANKLKFTTVSFLVATASFSMTPDATDSDTDSEKGKMSAGRLVDQSASNVISGSDSIDAQIEPIQSITKKRPCSDQAVATTNKRPLPLPDQKAFAWGYNYNYNNGSGFNGSKVNFHFQKLELIGLGSPAISSNYKQLVDLGFDCPVYDSTDHLYVHFSQKRA